MPLPDKAGLVAIRLERFGERDLLQIEGPPLLGALQSLAVQLAHEIVNEPRGP